MNAAQPFYGHAHERRAETIAARARGAIDELSGGDVDRAAIELHIAALAATRLAAERHLVADEARDEAVRTAAGEDIGAWTGIPK